MKTSTEGGAVQDYGGLIVLGVVAVPVILLALYVRRPYDTGSVPRDALSSRGKASANRPLGVLENKAFEDQMRDKAADLPQKSTH